MPTKRKFSKKLFTMLENEAISFLKKQLKEQQKPKPVQRFKDKEIF